MVPQKASLEVKDVTMARKLSSAVVKNPLYAVVLARKKDGVNEKYFDSKIDVKSDPSVDLLLSQLETARQMIRNGLGNKPIAINLTFDCSTSMFLSVVTTGIVAKVQTLVGSLGNEWSSLAALFDEYKMNAAHVAFQTLYVAGSGACDGMLGIAYDPTDSTALTGTIKVTEYAQHRIYAPGVITYAGGQYPQLQPASFEARMPKGLNLVLASSAPIVEGEWTGTAIPGVYGYLKTYWSPNTAVATNTANGICTMRCEFRCRY